MPEPTEPTPPEPRDGAGATEPDEDTVLADDQDDDEGAGG
ncbi:hypothetical protein amrb99_98390 [Actinomadura sp. RB99]|nr:hypothetical protein [Actinomadura sp. RB99]